MSTAAGHLYLPQLTGENIKPPEKIGHWMNHEQSIMIGISDAIDVGERDHLRGVSAVPDIWARPLMFQSAIKPGSKHPLRKKMIQEWRGLLSLLALWKIKKCPISIISVDLDQGTFSNALKRLAPKPVQLEQNVKYDWKDILLIRYHNIPIGAFSPTTLVYTATKYNALLKNEDFSLRDADGYLCPPSGEDREEIEYVGKWLINLQRSLNAAMFSNQSNPDHKSIAVLNDLIEEWLKEIRSNLALKDGEEIDAKGVKLSEDYAKSATFLEKYTVYQLLLRPLQKAVEETGEEGKGHSDIALSLRPERNYSGFKEVVVITEHLLTTNVRIWEPQDHASIYLKDLGGNAKSCVEKYFENKEGWGEDISGYADLRQEEAIWIRPEKYFLTDTLLKAKNGSFLTDGEYAYNSGGLSMSPYILPFKKEILFFFSPKDINEILKPKFKQDGENVEFSFNLPIVGDKLIEIKKVYKTKGIGIGEGTIVRADVPVIEIFPNYLDRHWRRYYVFQGNAEHMSVEPVIFGEKLVTECLHEETFPESKQKVRIIEINGDNAFPEGLWIKSSSGQYAGLILIQRPAEPHGLTKKWTIGIDFGTSNTNVFKQSSTSEMAECWHFDFPKYIRQISDNQDGIRERLMEEYFVPIRQIDLPVPTTLKIFNLAKKNNLMLDYFIFFPSKYQLPHNVYTDIKWDVEGERKTQYFIESLLFLLLIEVVNSRVAEIEFLCSYPKAFSQNNITVLKGEWDGVFKRVFKESSRVINYYENTNDVDKILIGKKIVSGEIEMKPAFETEGIAAGEYFGSEKTISVITERAKKEIAAICLDVGGGTTDVSIWHVNNIVFDASVTLAGRQISQLFQRNGRLAELLFTREAVIFLDEKKKEPAFFAARLNLILRNEEHRIREMLVKHANQRDVQWLRQMLAIEFCAISFYAAMISSSADKTIVGGKLADRIVNDGICLHWGGNAAKFINWIDFGNYDRNGIASKMLSAAYYNCLKDIGVKPKVLAHFQSPGHKCEAAGGLVVMGESSAKSFGANISEIGAQIYDYDEDMLKDKAKHHSDGVVCGDTIELSDRIINFADIISEKDLFAGNKTKFKSTSLERLAKFIDIMNLFGIKLGLFTEDTKVNLSEDYKRTIRDKMLSEFIKAQSLKEGQRLIEPVFIMEVKVLLEILRDKLR